MPSLEAEDGSIAGAGDGLIRALAAYASVKVFAKNALIISEGEQSAGSIYLINSGRVKVFLCSADGKEIDLSVLEAGNYFGEMSLD